MDNVYEQQFTSRNRWFCRRHVREAFVRNTQIRCTMSNLQVSPENPETYGGDASEDSVPDVIAKYTFKGDWGNISVAGLGR